MAEMYIWLQPVSVQSNTWDSDYIFLKGLSLMACWMLLPALYCAKLKTEQLLLLKHFILRDTARRDVLVLWQLQEKLIMILNLICQSIWGLRITATNVAWFKSFHGRFWVAMIARSPSICLHATSLTWCHMVPHCGTQDRSQPKCSAAPFFHPPRTSRLT